ncbi:MAG: DUF3841 domain-containing protein [Lachnospiraceae bacterium]|nr:DUF3841 domain-containing protein [Lachnospiraceae bacterium]
MKLWTIQTLEVYEIIEKRGIFHCDFRRSWMKSYYRNQYAWLAGQMRKRIGNPPRGVQYPIWAWYQWEGIRKKPDLRRERWHNGNAGDQYVCMEIDIPDDEVLLSDFDAWSIILNDGLLSSTEEEDKRIERKYNAVSKEGQRIMKEKNWEGVFDLSQLDNEWMIRGDSIQATFWELKKDHIKTVRHFSSASRRK